MPILGITGGIATGKSSFSALLSRQTGATLFDADQCSRELLQNNPAVKQAVRDAFGEGVFTSEGETDRRALREIVFASAESRRALEKILHPIIRERWISLAERARTSGEWLAIDIPLLFETGTEEWFDHIVTIACRHSIQMQRLLNIRKLEPALAAGIIAAQMDLNVKIQKAGHLVWNDGPQALLEPQAQLLAHYFQKRHG